LSQENSVNVLTHFKIKKMRNSLQKGVPLDKQVALFFNPCMYVTLAQLQTQSLRIVTCLHCCLSMLLSCKYRYSTK